MISQKNKRHKHIEKRRKKIFGWESLRADERVLNAVCTALITLYHISHNQLKYSFFCKQKGPCLWLILVKSRVNVNYSMIYIKAVSAVRKSNKFTKNIELRNWQRKLILIKSEFGTKNIRDGIMWFNIKLIKKWNWQYFDVDVLLSANHTDKKIQSRT